jgi:hypothetical protein
MGWYRKKKTLFGAISQRFAMHHKIFTARPSIPLVLSKQPYLFKPHTMDPMKTSDFDKQGHRIASHPLGLLQRPDDSCQIRLYPHPIKLLSSACHNTG